MIYGTALFVLGFMLVGMGHGTYVLLLVSSQPVLWLGAILPSNFTFLSLLFGSMTLWATAALFSVWQFGRLRLVFPLVMAVHYYGTILFMPEFYDQWEPTARHLWGSPYEKVTTISWIALYFSGQIALWLVYRAGRKTAPNGGLW